MARICEEPGFVGVGVTRVAEKSFAGFVVKGEALDSDAIV